jgi:CubicO group peptidase (beta-lactamase class C family)
MIRPTTWVVLLGCVASTALAAPPPDRGLERQRLDAVARPLIENGYLRSAVIGLLDSTGPRVYAYGRLGPANDSPLPDGDTVYEIASITKTFTATLLSEMAQRNEVALDDVISEYLPESVKLPQTDKPMTLAAIATHHSGLPRLPSNLKPRGWDDPYAEYDSKKLYAYLPGAKVHPTATFEYSNLAYSMLGHALSRRAGKSYEELLVERIAKPLGMDHTRVTFTAEMKKRLAPPFDADLDAANNWQFADLPAGGGIRSSVNDMLKYLAAQIDLPGAVPETLRKAIAVTHEDRADAGPGGMRIGLGWHITRAGLHWHNGQTGGYHSYAAFDEKAKLAVVVLTNTATGQVDTLGNRAMTILRGNDARPLNLPTPVTLEAAKLDRVAGHYVEPGGVPVQFDRDGGRLTYTALGVAPVRLYPSGDTEFFAKASNHRVTFEADKAGKITGVTIKVDAKSSHAQRIDLTPAR